MNSVNVYNRARRELNKRMLQFNKQISRFNETLVP